MTKITGLLALRSPNLLDWAHSIVHEQFIKTAINRCDAHLISRSMYTGRCIYVADISRSEKGNKGRFDGASG